MRDTVIVLEVSPRDGLQNESVVVDTATKVELVDRLTDAGLPVVEATSFVRPDLVPQLADAAEVMAGITRAPGVRYPVLVPNERGLDAAIAAGATEIAVFASATDSFARRNLGRPMADQMAMFTPVVARARAHGLPVRGYVSMCFGDPWEGDVDVAQVVGVGRRLVDLGVGELSLGDTIGVGTPGHVEAMVAAFERAGVPTSSLAMHFHDTYGQALSNALAALRCGVTTFDASAGGLGGCPYADSATGNLATEDLVWQLHGLGIETGVDLEALVATSVWLAGVLGRPSPSRVVQALADGR
jgi:hydroxymethylglutaryl-CoA lyase